MPQWYNLSYKDFVAKAKEQLSESEVSLAIEAWWEIQEDLEDYANSIEEELQ